jgi:hypothetical protein
MRQSIFALFLSTALAACAGQGGTSDTADEGGDDEGGGDEGGGDDEGGDEGYGERPAECPSGEMGAVASLGEAEAFNDPLEDSETGPRVRYLWGTIDETTEFEIDLYDGYGAFKAAPAAPGSYTIQGEDADPLDCGLCVYLTFATDEWYWSLQATGGTVQIDTVDGRLKGTASGLTFKELSDVDEGYMEGGCAATIDSVPFDTEYTVYEEEPPA